MEYKVIIDNDKEYGLASWNAQAFNANPTLIILSTDFQDIKQSFTQINEITIFNGSVQVAQYSAYNTFSSISYAGRVYVEGRGIFVDAMAVELSIANLVEQVKRLDEQINPVIDVDAMSIHEYKTYKIEQIKKDVQDDIFNGVQVVLHDGSVETFALTLEDQNNISSLYMTAVAGKGKVSVLPFHSHGNYCREYDVIDIVLLYIEMQKAITIKTTIANFAINKAREALTKAELDDIYYGMTFDATTTAQIDGIINNTFTTINMILEDFMPENVTE